MGHHGAPLLMMTTSGLKSLGESAEEEQINQDIRYIACFHAAVQCSDTAHAVMQTSQRSLGHLLQEMDVFECSILCLVCDAVLTLLTIKTLLVIVEYLMHLSLQPADLDVLVQY